MFFSSLWYAGLWIRIRMDPNYFSSRIIFQYRVPDPGGKYFSKKPVLWIRIRLDPELLPESGTRKIQSWILIRNKSFRIHNTDEH